MKNVILAFGLFLMSFNTLGYSNTNEIQEEMNILSEEINDSSSDTRSDSLQSLLTMGLRYIDSKLTLERKKIERKLNEYRDDLSELEEELSGPKDDESTKDDEFASEFSNEYLKKRKTTLEGRIAKLELKLQLLDDLQQELDNLKVSLVSKE